MPEWLVLVGAMLTVLVQFFAFIIGVARFKKWFETAVVEPYVKPMKIDLEAVKNGQDAHRDLLQQHDRWIHVLMGKQFGGIPTMEVDNKDLLK